MNGERPGPGVNGAQRASAAVEIRRISEGPGSPEGSEATGGEESHEAQGIRGTQGGPTHGDIQEESDAVPPIDADTDPGPDTLDLRHSDELDELGELVELVELIAYDRPEAPVSRDPDLLDGLAGWGPVDTPAGAFQLVPVRIERDLRLVARWMNDPAVAAFWGLAGPDSASADHLRAQLDGDGRSVPCLGVLGGVPMSYWEVYRADLDPLARYYPARPHDTGLHLLIGKVSDRGRGLGTTLLRTVADLVLDHRPSCGRVVAEPDLRNTPCVAAFLGAGFRLTGEVDLPDKRVALMIRDRSLRDVL